MANLTHISKSSRGNILVLLLCINLVLVKAQNDYARLPFLNLTANKLYMPSDSTMFTKLFLRMLTLSSTPSANNITVVHIGGSHVQAGIWTNTFENDLRNKFTSGGGGYFVFPYKIAKTNGQPYASAFTNGNWKRCRAISQDTCSPLGMNGIRVSTNDTNCVFGLALKPKAGIQKANLVHVYHNFNASFSFKINNAAIQSRTDFLEAGYTAFELTEANDSISFTLTRLDTLQRDFHLYGFSLLNTSAPGFFVAGLGANGASSTSFLKCNLFVPQLKTIQPDLVILSLGVNDTQSKGFEKEDYIEHYDTLINRIKEANPNVCIVLTTTTDNYVRHKVSSKRSVKTSNKSTIQAQEAMFDLMKKHNVAVWDLFEVMGGYKSMAKWQKAGMAARDKVHFTAGGYVAVGHLMYEAFLKSILSQPNRQNH